MTAEFVAKSINDDCRKGLLFWACGLIRETIELWRKPLNLALLCDVAQTMATHYLEE